MTKKTKEQQVVILKIIGLSVLIGLLFGFVFGMSINKDIKRTSVCHDMFKFNETLETINKNCGSVFFTKQYGQNYFTIYKQECKEGGFCKAGYVNIESCLDDANLGNNEN